MDAKGTLRISRTSSTRGPDKITIAVVDEKSRVQFLTTSMPLEDFAQAVTGLLVDVDMELHIERLGKTREHKRELVPFDSLSLTEGDIDAALAPFEVFGWKGRGEDMTNHHNRNSDGKQLVSFTRYV